MRIAWAVPLAVVPVVLWLGQDGAQRWILSGIFLLLTALRPPVMNFRNAGRWWTAAMIALAVVTAYSHSSLPMKLYPVFINAAMLAAFGATLLRPPSMVERFARIREPDLSPHAVAYTRRVTMVWCAFFALNGSAALATALWAPLRIWVLYNGIVAYILTGIVFAVEYAFRLHFKARLHA